MKRNCQKITREGAGDDDHGDGKLDDHEQIAQKVVPLEVLPLPFRAEMG
ncbi:MAG: hypothetical protein R2751_14585 [Bacteroidales bacterium]